MSGIFYPFIGHLYFPVTLYGINFFSILFII